MSPAAATPLATAPPPGRTGFFGKLPGRGDFVRRDLPNAFVEDWDAWVQRGMAASRAALGAGWLDVWLCAPIWRFAFVGGVCGPDAWAGVLMPSVDRAGRYYPLTLASAVPHGAPVASLVATDWMAAVEGVALAALDESVDFDRFGDAVTALPPPPSAPADVWAGGWRARATPGDPAGGGLAMAVAGLVMAAPRCVFASRGGGHVPPSAWILPGLPPADAFIGLIADQSAPRPGATLFAAPAGPADPGAPAWAAPAAAAGAGAVVMASSPLGIHEALLTPDNTLAALPAETPGGMFDRLLEADAPSAPGSPPAPPALFALDPPPAPGTPPPGALFALDAPPAPGSSPPGALFALDAPSADEAPPAVEARLPADALLPMDALMPAEAPRSLGATLPDDALLDPDSASTSPTIRITADPPAEFEAETDGVTRRPPASSTSAPAVADDLFGDSGHDVPPVPTGGLFDHEDREDNAA